MYVETKAKGTPAESSVASFGKEKGGPTDMYTRKTWRSKAPSVPRSSSSSKLRHIECRMCALLAAAASFDPLSAVQ
jgi:hypothetical protein